MALSLALGLVYILTVPAGAWHGSVTARPTTPWTSGPHNDLHGRMLSMMSQSVVRFNVLGTPQDRDIYGLTVCLRTISETMSQYSRPVTILTLTMSNSPIFSLTALYYKYELQVGGEKSEIRPEVAMFEKSFFPWTSLCVTWDSASGMTQMWKDGMISVRIGMLRSQKFYGTPVVTLSGFVGQVTDIHMWDKALPFSDLRSYNQGWGYPSGNLLSWRNISYTSKGYAVLEDAYPRAQGPAEKGRTGKQQRRKCRPGGARQ